VDLENFSTQIVDMQNRRTAAESRLEVAKQVAAHSHEAYATLDRRMKCIAETVEPKEVCIRTYISF